MEKIAGLTISEHNNSKRIVNIDIDNEIIEKLYKLYRVDFEMFQYEYKIFLH